MPRRHRLFWVVALLPLAACGGGTAALIVTRADAGRDTLPSGVDRPPPSRDAAGVVDLGGGLDAALESAPDGSADASFDESSDAPSDADVTSPFCTRGVDVAARSLARGFTA